MDAKKTMRNDFCVFILTHGRPNNVSTLETLRKCGYTGKVYIVIDDEDKTESEYKRLFGDNVLKFSKTEIAKSFDEGDNFRDRRAIIYARNACWGLANIVNCRYFIQLDDDYTDFSYRINKKGHLIHKYIKNLDCVFSYYLNFLIKGNLSSIAMGQGGDYIGGDNGSGILQLLSGMRSRKCMNSFFCDTNNKFYFFGRINEDVNTYVCSGMRGNLFLTVFIVALQQKQTQSNIGGMTDIYAQNGTYIKSFYTVMYSPSCTKVFMLKSRHQRLHHAINWNAAVPKIIREEHRKP